MAVDVQHEVVSPLEKQNPLSGLFANSHRNSQTQSLQVTEKYTESWMFRARDIIVACLGLTVLSPLLLAIGVAIRLESPGSSLFRQRRGGLRGEPFWCLKFRTMTVCEDGPVIKQATVNDPRVTKLGRFLRRTSLDELPQLINVLRGEMTLVGPRPHALAHDTLYCNLIPHYRLRAAVKPGMTGLAQIAGLRGNCATHHDMALRVSKDIEYARNKNFSRDLKILASTPMIIASCLNAH